MEFLNRTTAIRCLFASFFALSCVGRGRVDLSTAIPLTAEPVGHAPNANVPQAALFSAGPGKAVSFKALAAVDPVGTTIIDDFDGDGIRNNDEKNTSFWIADFPKIEARIVTPVTMKIAVNKTSTNEIDSIISEITSDDYEDTKAKGSEKIHQNEVNTRTLQFQDVLTTGSTSGGSTESSSSVSANAGVSIGPFSLGGSASGSSKSTSSWSSSSNFVQTIPKWIDKPFKNDLDRDAWSVKSDSAAKNARKYRVDKRTKEAAQFVSGPAAGYVRAAMYIKNLTVNMPVKVSNILASLVFETQQGQIIPVQSFRLRNEDFSLFSVSVYGSSEFGPYVVELNNLNTAEVEKAIKLGYSPKIYIVDYELEHVADSNYRPVLSSNFSGNNLKIIEENAKGRTASIKVLAPNSREIYRVGAFSTTTENLDACAPLALPNSSSSAVPGATLSRMLERISCVMAQGGKVGGIPVIEMADYVLDFTGVPKFQDMNPNIVFVRGIKKIGGIQNNVPCDEAYIDVCYIKLGNMTQSQQQSFAMWTVFADTKYFDYSQFDFVDQSGNGEVNGYPSGTWNFFSKTGAIPKIVGVNAILWPGDELNITYMSAYDLLDISRNYGTNPLETGASMSFNTNWDLGQLGEFPFDPATKSVFLGKAGLGDQIELVFNLKDTTFLNPNFGLDVDSSSNLSFTNFTYNQQKSNKKFSIEEALDFEISMATGGAESDWQNIMRPLAPSGPPNENMEKISATLDYQAQQFTVTIKLPATHHLVAADGVVSLYLRPALSNAYRSSIWPQDYAKIKKYDAKLVADAATGSSTLHIDAGIGSISDLSPGDIIKIDSNGTIYAYPLSTTPSVATPGYDLDLASSLSGNLKTGDRVYIDANLLAPQLSLDIDYNDSANNFFTAFTGQYPQRPLVASSATIVNCAQTYAPLFCAGYSSNYAQNFVVNNWIGNMSFQNNWVDGDIFRKALPSNLLVNPFIVGNYPVAGQYGTMGLNFLRQGSDFEIQIETTAATINQSNPSVAASGNKALISWSVGTSNQDIWARFVDLSTGISSSNDFMMNTTTAGAQWPPATAVAGNNGIVVWGSTDSDSSDVRGRLADMATGIAIGTDFLISTTNANSQFLPKVVAFGTRALVVWGSNHNGSDFDIRGRFMDLTTGAGIGNDFPISTTNQGNQTQSYVAVSGNRALVVWDSTDNGFDSDVRGRLLDLGTGLAIGSDFLISTSNGGAQIVPKVAISGDRALIVWTSGNDARGRVMDLTTGAGLGDDFLIANAAGMPVVTMHDNRALVVWNGVRGRIIDIANQTPIGKEFTVSTSSANNYNPEVTSVGNRALVVWWSNHICARPYQLLPKYGLNNFFTAPLIERNYTTTAKILK